jgi:hypothetical protein
MAGRNKTLIEERKRIKEQRRKRVFMSVVGPAGTPLKYMRNNPFRPKAESYQSLKNRV